MSDALIVLLWEVWPYVAAVLGIAALELWLLSRRRDE
jgi:hypothetical protein